MRATCYVGLLAAASLALVAAFAIPACGRECGPGTYQDGDQCVAGMEVACGPGTVAAGGQCVPADGGGGAGCGPGTVQRGSQCVPELPPGVNGSRFLTLTMAEPAGVAALVNTVLGPAVTDGRVVILWKSRGVTSGTPLVRAMSFGSGVAVPQEDGTNVYVMSATVSSTTTAEIAADQTFATAPFVFKFPVLPEAGESGILRVEQTIVTCQMGVGGLLDPAVTCTCIGGITQANADAVYIEAIGTTLGQLLVSEPKLFDCDLDGAPDCWKMSASFTVEPAAVDDELLQDGGV
jgi:hypothetical protein